MAISYTDLFSKIGKFVCISERMLEVQEMIASDYVEDVKDEFTNDLQDAETIAGFTEEFVSQAAGLESVIESCLAYTNAVLADLQTELVAPSADVETILPLLYLRMGEDSETVNANAITSPVVTAAAGNNGNGTILASEINVKDVDDERIIDETVQFFCTSDSDDTTDAVFSVAGNPEYSRLSWRTLGSGADEAVESPSGTLISDGDFENVPGSWTTVAGADLIKTEETNQYRGDACLLLESDGATATATLSQDLTLEKNIIYCATVRLKNQNAVDGSSNLNIFIDTESEELATPIEVFNADPDTIDSDWELYSVFFTLPETRTEDQLTAYIDWTDADGVTVGKQILLDDLIISQAFIFGNVAYSIVPGSDNFVQNDYINVTTGNSYEGHFQTYFGRYYNFQLPSNSVHLETISDNLTLDCPSICGSGT